MASAQPVFRDGGSGNKPPCFVGEHYDFWKIRMQAFLEAQGEEIWDAVENGPFIPTTVVNNVVETKVKASWTDDDKRKVLFDKKAKNLLQSALGMDEFFRISQCKTAKEIWDTLEVTHEGTTEVKRSKLNTLSQEYEMFRMQPGETILDLQKRFSHLTNHLMALGKTFTNDELNLKVLRSLTRAWQPKVTAISEKKSLSKMSLAALFGKLQEHEMELDQLERHEGRENKVRTLALKTKARDYDSDDEESQSEKDDEDVEVLFKKFKNFLKREKTKKLDQGKKFNGESTSRQNFTCFECGKQGHMKSDCPTLQKKSGHKRKKEFKPKKAYIAWDDNEISSSSDSESKEYANLALMASHHSDDEYEEVSSKSSSYDNDLQSAFNELYEEFLKLFRKYSNQKKTILKLESMANDTKVELEEVKNSTCNKCHDHESKIVELNQVIKKYEKGQIGLENVLSSQRFSNDKCGLGFSNFDKLSTSHNTFVKTTCNKFNNNESKKEHVVNYHKRTYDRNNFYGNKENHIFRPTCFYCNTKGHTPNACYVRNIGVPNGEYIWIKKGINPRGPKEKWVPRKYY
ncbi:uncharacterized protein LOC123892341 [Trifolium pratense]|uniref:uncharacterized protein LOC123892341 n=1 Tax=Trifolium pratense TaxID=57577 RepID=UPI001E690705|nr:uncharacterized protein LOC123892341 [Trifolium pratense]